MKNLIYVLALGMSAFVTVPLSGQSPPIRGSASGDEERGSDSSV